MTDRYLILNAQSTKGDEMKNQGGAKNNGSHTHAQTQLSMLKFASYPVLRLNDHEFMSMFF